VAAVNAVAKPSFNPLAAVGRGVSKAAVQKVDRVTDKARRLLGIEDEDDPRLPSLKHWVASRISGIFRDPNSSGSAGAGRSWGGGGMGQPGWGGHMGTGGYGNVGYGPGYGYGGSYIGMGTGGAINPNR